MRVTGKVRVMMSSSKQTTLSGLGAPSTKWLSLELECKVGEKYVCGYTVTCILSILFSLQLSRTWSSSHSTLTEDRA